MNGRSIRLVSRRMIRSLRVALVFGSLSASSLSPGLADDKPEISLQCGGTRVVIKCTKMIERSCSSSAILFRLSDGRSRKIAPAKNIPQNFDLPTIPDALECSSGKNGKHYISIIYSPGIHTGDSTYFDLVSEDGTRITSNQHVIGRESKRLGIISKVGAPLTLREADPPQ